MRKRSNLYSMMAKVESAKKAEKVKELRELHNAHSHADEMTTRLREILEDRQVKGPVLAAQLRNASTLNTKIANEAATQAERTEQLAKALDQSRAEFAQQDYKTQYLLTAATKARREEREEAEARAEASRPIPRK